MTKQDHGTVKYNNKVLTLTQQPYPDGTVEWPTYQACAVDAKGNEYEITWPEIDAATDDGGDACDWDDYDVREL